MIKYRLVECYQLFFYSFILRVHDVLTEVKDLLQNVNEILILTLKQIHYIL